MPRFSLRHKGSLPRKQWKKLHKPNWMVTVARTTGTSYVLATPPLLPACMPADLVVELSHEELLAASHLTLSAGPPEVATLKTTYPVRDLVPLPDPSLSRVVNIRIVPNPKETAQAMGTTTTPQKPYHNVPNGQAASAESLAPAPLPAVVKAAPPAPPDPPKLPITIPAEVKAPVITWPTYPPFEEAMAEAHVSYKLERKCLPTKVNLFDSAKNSARKGPNINKRTGVDDNRAKYITACVEKEGSAVWFPFLGIMNPSWAEQKDPDYPLVLGGGLHRFPTTLKLKLPMAVYLVDPKTSLAVFKRLAYLHNKFEGRGYDQDERMQFAVDEALSTGLTDPDLKELAEHYGLTTCEGRFRDAFRVAQSRQWMDDPKNDLYVPGARRLNAAQVSELLPLQRMAGSYKLLVGEILKLPHLPDSKSLRGIQDRLVEMSSAEAREVTIFDWLKSKREEQEAVKNKPKKPKTDGRIATPGGQRRTPAQQIMAAAGNVQTIVGKVIGNAAPVDVLADPKVRSSVVKRLDETISIMQALAEKLR